MPYCPNCGVELAPEAPSCPLCGSHTAHCKEEDRLAEHLIDPEDREKLTDRERRTIVWEILSVSGLIAALAVSAVNLILDHRLSWSLYPLFSLAFVWVILTALFRGLGRPLLAALGPALALPAFLIGLDLVDGGLRWALLPAIPIALCLEIAVVLTALAIARAKRKGANVVAFVLLGAEFTCLGIEIVLDLFAGNPLFLSWSSIVGFALVPVAAFLLYLHYRVGKKANLRKIFRL